MRSGDYTYSCKKLACCCNQRGQETAQSSQVQVRHGGLDAASLLLL